MAVGFNYLLIFERCVEEFLLCLLFLVNPVQLSPPFFRKRIFRLPSTRFDYLRLYGKVLKLLLFTLSKSKNIPAWPYPSTEIRKKKKEKKTSEQYITLSKNHETPILLLLQCDLTSKRPLHIDHQNSFVFSAQS